MTVIEDLAFRYVAVDRSGKRISDVVRARDAKAATRRLAADGLTTLSLREEKVKTKDGKDRDLNFTERVAVLRQLSLMVEAGVGLLEAIETVALGITAIKGRKALENVVAALKRGDSFANAMERYAPSYPFYVYAMSRVGEATGKLAEVLRDASEQMAYENKLRRDVISAMTYPGFLLGVALLAVGFILMVVVPKFAEMVGDLSKVPTPSRIVLTAGVWASSHKAYALGGAACIAIAIAVTITNKTVKAAFGRFAVKLPVIGPLIRTREIAAWSRLTGFALSHGVGLLEAAQLGRQGAAEGPFKQSLENLERDLKAGISVDASLAQHTKLQAMDLSLLRAGAKSGALARMFLFIAEAYDASLKDSLKRATGLLEPFIILLISVLIGGMAMSIVMALMSVYQNIN
ncbi:MAG: hypothetical protein JWM33_1889 [Caulobacteraceae bacterium]|nr:hypothetical protein [Caulobacteraceae bacterium]